MPVSEFTRKLIETRLSVYFTRKIPPHARDQIKLIHKITGDRVTVIESRPYYKDSSIWTETPIAQFRFNLANKKWALYWMDRHSKWHLYDMARPSPNFDDMLRELERDPSGIFWG